MLRSRSAPARHGARAIYERRSCRLENTPTGRSNLLRIFLTMPKRREKKSPPKLLAGKRPGEGTLSHTSPRCQERSDSFRTKRPSTKNFHSRDFGWGAHASRVSVFASRRNIGPDHQHPGPCAPRNRRPPLKRREFSAPAVKIAPEKCIVTFGHNIVKGMALRWIRSVISLS